MRRRTNISGDHAALLSLIQFALLIIAFVGVYLIRI